MWETVPNFLGPVVQSAISLTSSLRVISLTVLADSIHNILIFFAEKMWTLLTFFQQKFQHICVSLDVNFNESLTNDIVSFEQLGPDVCPTKTQNNLHILRVWSESSLSAWRFLHSWLSKMRPVMILIRLYEYTVWSESWLLSTWRNFAFLALLNASSEDSNQTIWMHSLILIFARRTSPKLHYLALLLICQACYRWQNRCTNKDWEQGITTAHPENISGDLNLYHPLG